jgi:hypothetical protein
MRLSTRHHQSEPRSHERIWRDRRVDRNLKDEWLISLNDLKTFDLISICEGHNAQRHAYPHINLRLKEEYLSRVSNEWYCSTRTMSKVIDNIFDSEQSRTEIELRVIYRRQSVRNTCRQDFVVKIQSLVRRESESIDTRIIDWFDLTIKAVRDLDTFIFDLCKDAEETEVSVAYPTNQR